MLKAHGKGIMKGEAQIQPKESARGVRLAPRKGESQSVLWIARPSPSISPVPT